MKRRRGFHLYATVIGEAERLAGAIRQAAGVRRIKLVGELRRCLEVVRTISILASADRPRAVLEGLRQVEGLGEVTQVGNRITAVSSLGIPVSVTVSDEIAAHAMLASSASEEHLATLAARADCMRVPWNLTGENGGLAPKADSEEALYAALGLPYIVPELREGLGEIEAAEAGRLNPLVDVGHIQGVFHNHTTYSDGSASLEEMVAAARKLGYRYIGISDHSQSAFYANGLKEDRIREQHAAIDALQRKFSDIRIFKGIEADILADGEMDYADNVLAGFDFVIASVHSRFNLSEEDQTRRICLALANPHVTMLGHATGRLLLSREGYRVDVRKVIETAAAHGKIIEINANPHRLDLDWRHCREAKARGVRVSINPDAHATDGLEDVPFGVNVARKGGLEPGDVVNTLGPDEILPALRRAGKC